MAEHLDDPGRPCSRVPGEFCDGARIIRGPDGGWRREPALTPRAFCDPCRSRIIRCLDELPYAYVRLGFALGETPRAGLAGRVPFGPSEPVRGEVDALMRTMAAVLGGWAARVQAVAALHRGDPRRDPAAPGAVRDAAGTLRAHADVLLALRPGWTVRTWTYPPARPGAAGPAEQACRHCGCAVTRSPSGQRWWPAETPPRPGCAHEPAPGDDPPGRSPVPAWVEDETGGEDIVRAGDGWLQVLTLLGGADAGNEILTLHYRARRILGETRARPETFDGIPCRACEAMTLERAEPPSDPALEAMHSRCPGCGDEMDRDTFAGWAETYASWARGAGIQACRRCNAGNCRECSWHACACTAGDHPRRRAAA
jgi:hypothetical protein